MCENMEGHQSKGGDGETSRVIRCGAFAEDAGGGGGRTGGSSDCYLSLHF